MLPSISLPCSSFPGFCLTEKVCSSILHFAIVSKHCLLFVGLRPVIGIAVTIASILCPLSVPSSESSVCLHDLFPLFQSSIVGRDLEIIPFPLSPAITSVFCSRKFPQNFWCAKPLYVENACLIFSREIIYLEYKNKNKSYHWYCVK